MKLSLIFLVGILCLSLVSALDISASYDSNVLVRGINSSIKLSLVFENAPLGLYNVYTLSGVSISPGDIFSIDKKQTIKKEFEIRKTENLKTKGFYTFVYTINQRGVKKINKRMTIRVVDLGDILEISSNINPDSGSAVLSIENKENVSLNNLSARFKSVLFDFQKTISLGPYEKKEISVKIDKDKLKKVRAGTYIINAFFKTNKGEEKITGNLNIGKKEHIATEKSRGGFLIVTETITKINTGNTVETVEIKMSYDLFSRIFTSFNVEPTGSESRGLSIEYSWVKKIGPSEFFTVKTKTNYLIPLLILIFGIIAFIGIKRYKETMIEVKKSVSRVRTKRGEFALKVRISVKARKDVENLTLIDKIPSVVKIYKKFGVRAPDKIDVQNRRIYWNIGDLEEGEERTFSYIIYSKISIIGKFSLPEAVAVFERDGQISEVGSNKVFFQQD